jgi:hypothetical protein
MVISLSDYLHEISQSVLSTFTRRLCKTLEKPTSLHFEMVEPQCGQLGNISIEGAHLGVDLVDLGAIARMVQ